MKYINVPYEQKDQAKELGARWDPHAKSWYVPDNCDPTLFVNWEYKDPYQSFLQDLIEAGCYFKPNEILMDGTSHRVAVEGDHKGEKSGYYIGHLNGIPNGYFFNNRTKFHFKKTYKTNELVSSYCNHDQIQYRELIEQKIKEDLQLKQAAAQMVANDLACFLVPLKSTLQVKSPYFARKQIQGTEFTFMYGKTTCIPLYDITGKLTTVEFVRLDGSKRFAKGGIKQGSFHVIHGNERLKSDHSIIFICEGYATASSVQQAIPEHTVIAAMDSGNLIRVSKSIRTIYPNCEIVICADNDRFTSLNVGLVEAQKVAKELNNIKILLPIFKDKEVGTDFNDLMLISSIESIRESILKGLG